MPRFAELLKVVTASALLILLFGSASVADTVILKNGGTLEGRLLEKTPTHVRFEVKGVGVQTIPLSDIERIETSHALEDQFAEKRDGLDPDDAEGAFALGVWCEENDLEEQATEMFLRVLEIEPNHRRAREKLGHMRFGTAWLAPEEYRDLIRPELGSSEMLGKTGITFRAPVGWERGDDDGRLRFSSPEVLDIRLLLGVEELDGDPEKNAEAICRELRLRFAEVEGPDCSACEIAGEKALRLEWSWQVEDGHRTRVEMCLKRAGGGIRLWAETTSCGGGPLDALLEHMAGSLRIDEKKGRLFDYSPPGDQWISFFAQKSFLEDESGGLDRAKVQWMARLLKENRRALLFVGLQVILIDTSSEYAFMGVKFAKSVSDLAGLPVVEDLDNLRASFFLGSGVHLGADAKPISGSKRKISFGRMRGSSEEFRAGGNLWGRVVFLRRAPYWIVSVVLRVGPGKSARDLIRSHDKLLRTLRLP